MTDYVTPEDLASAVEQVNGYQGDDVHRLLAMARREIATLEQRVCNQEDYISQLTAERNAELQAAQAGRGRLRGALLKLLDYHYNCTCDGCKEARAALSIHDGGEQEEEGKC